MVTLPYSSLTIPRLRNTARAAARKLIRPFTWTSASFWVLTEQHNNEHKNSPNEYKWIVAVNAKVFHGFGSFKEGLFIINYNIGFELDLIFQRWTKFGFYSRIMKNETFLSVGPDISSSSI